MSNKRAEILTAASNILLEKGIKNMTLANVAETLGISKGTLYYYYPSKKELVIDIAKNYLDSITMHLEEIIQQHKNKTQFELLVENIITYLLDQNRISLHFNLIKEAIIAPDDIKQLLNEAYHTWYSLLEISFSQQYPELCIDRKILSALVVSMLDGLSIQRIIGIDEYDVKAITNVFLNILNCSKLKLNSLS